MKITRYNITWGFKEYGKRNSCKKSGERYIESELLKHKKKQLARNLTKGEIKLEMKNNVML